ncbi:MAG: hypothetical protein IJH83_04710 [Coriobacteriales bacterium]|nr:hypothetical protein [Coriobacteriales bacterium]
MKILILSANTGGGHNGAARAIAEELEARGIQTTIKNGLDFVPAPMRSVLERGHSIMYRYAPDLYGTAYELTEQQEGHRLLYLDYAKYALPLVAFLTKEGFDAVVATHIFAAFMLTGARKLDLLASPAFFVNTDYSFTPGAEETAMDGWFVAKGFADEFAQRGIPRDRVFETGIPVDSANYNPLARDDARRVLGLRDDVKLVLLGAGAIGCGPIKELALQLRERGGGRVCVAVLTGRNRNLLRELSQEADDALLIPLPFTDKVTYWMAAADVMMLKAGGLSTTEAASRGLPMVLMDAVPGLETHNLDYFVGHGCAVTAQDQQGLCDLALRICDDPAFAEGIRQQQRELFGANAVAKLVDIVLARCEEA